MNEEVRKCVEHIRGNAEFQWCSDCYVSDGCGDAYKADCFLLRIATLIESLSAQLDQVTRERDAEESNKFQYETGFAKGFEAAYPKWISVKERLPEDDVKVIAIDLHGNIHTAIHRYENNYEREDVPGYYGYFSATHWMPLPEKPKEEET